MAAATPPHSSPMAVATPPPIFVMADLAPPSTPSMAALGSPSTSSMAAPAPPITSFLAAPAPPSTSPMASRAPPSASTMAALAQPSISTMDAPAPPSTSTMSAAAGKKILKKRNLQQSAKINRNPKLYSHADEFMEEEDDPLLEFDQYVSFKKGQSNNELDQYLKEELYPRKKELDILEWWKINSAKYPVLSRIARDILAIPAPTVPSESAFSSGGRIVSDYRSSLSCSTVEALICLQDWLRAADSEGYEGASLEREEEDKDYSQLT